MRSFILFICVVGSASAQTFLDVSTTAGIFVPGNNGAVGLDRGVCFGDFDGDQDLDLVALGTPGSPHRYFRNDGGGSFTDLTATFPLGISVLARAIAAADFDRDGDLDIYVGNTWNPNQFFVNDGNGVFTESAASAGIASMGNTMAISFGDYDRDGLVDLYLGNHIGPSGQPDANQLFRNRGDGTFDDVSAVAGVANLGFTFASIFFDYDEDGWPDIIVANDGGDLPGILANTMYRNLHNGTFADVGAQIGADRGMRAMGVDVVDVFNDGGFDCFITNIRTGHSFLVQDPITHNFTDQALQSGLIGHDLGWAMHFFDFDNDGWQDLFVNHSPTDGDPGISRLWQNPGAPSIPWPEVGAQHGVAFTGRKYTSAVADFDDDGAMDLFVLPYYQPGMLLKNTLPPQNWLKVKTVGTRSNCDGFGAVVTVSHGTTTQRQFVRSGVGFMSGSDPRLHFGLGASTTADRVEIRWPSGQLQVFTNLAAGQELVAIEPTLELSAPPIAGTTPNLRLVVRETPGRPCAFALTFSPAPGLPLPDGRVIPVTLDPLFFLSTNASAGILGSAITSLDATGVGTTALAIPAGPLAGFSFYGLAVTLNPLAASGIETIIAPALSITIQ